MNIENYINKMTKKDFLNYILNNNTRICPEDFNLVEIGCKSRQSIRCNECWNNAIINIQFRNDNIGINGEQIKLDLLNY